MALLIEEETAKKIYEYQPSWFQEILEKAFKKGCFKKINFKDLKTFDDLCRTQGTTEVEFEEKWENSPEHHVRYERMLMLYLAINQGWEMNTYDTTQRKWAPMFLVSSSGLGFSYSYYGCDYANAHVGFPLCYESEEKSNHAGKQFSKLWIEFITGKPLKS